MGRRFATYSNGQRLPELPGVSRYYEASNEYPNRHPFTVREASP
jgi:hypothetical protein